MRFIGFKIKESDYEELKQVAIEKDRNTSAFCRHIMLSYIRKWKEEKRLRK